MINDWVIYLIDFLDSLYNRYLHNLLDSLLSALSDWEDYRTLFASLLSGVFYICGKPLVIFVLSVFVIIIVIRIISAIIMLVGQFIP